MNGRKVASWASLQGFTSLQSLGSFIKLSFSTTTEVQRILILDYSTGNGLSVNCWSNKMIQWSKCTEL